MGSLAWQSPIKVSAGAVTHAGLRRRLNEDAHLATSPVFLVADGMGGHDAGEVASATVVDEFARFAGRDSVTLGEVRLALARARARVAALPVGAGAAAGTTLTGVAVSDVDGEGHWLVLNLGDSRTYRLSSGVFEQLTVDHSVVQELIDGGEIDRSMAARDSRRHVITRAIGAGSDADADYWMIPAAEGDRILVCSDGLTGEVDDSEIHEILRVESDPQEAAARLVTEAVRSGGRDNITVIVVDATHVSRGVRDGLGDTGLSGAFDDEVEEDTRPRAERLTGRRR